MEVITMKYASIASIVDAGRRHVPLDTSVGRLRIANWGRIVGTDADVIVPVVRHIVKSGNRRAFLRIVRRDKTLLTLFSGAIIMGIISISMLVIASMLLLS